LNVGKGGFGIWNLVAGRFGGQELDKLWVARQAFENSVIGPGQFVDLETGIVPGGNIAVPCFPLIENAFLAKIKIRIKIGGPIEKYSRAMRIVGISSGHVRGSQVSNPIDDGLLPLAKNQVSANESPPFPAIGVTLAIINTKVVKWVGGVGM